MARPDRHFDWDQLRKPGRSPARPIDGGRRMRWLGLAFSTLMLIVFSRAAQIVLFDGQTWRQHAAAPLEHRESLPATRGRILARDGTVLAIDQQVPALAVHYRYLEQPSNPTWLRNMVRARLSLEARRSPEAMARETEHLTTELIEERRRLAKLCGMSLDAWHRRVTAIGRRVRRIARHVNATHVRRMDSAGKQVPGNKASAAGDAARHSLESWLSAALRRFTPRVKTASRPAGPITIAEELDYHIIAQHVSLDVVAELEAHPDRYPGTRITVGRRRHYPAGSMAAHAIGYLGPATREDLDAESAAGRAYHADDWIGRVGVEAQYDSVLRGHRGLRIDWSDRSGRTLRSARAEAPIAGDDLVLTIDPTLQRTAEKLLDDALRRRAPTAEGGGAVVAINVRSGEILAAASAPRFDPNRFVQQDREAVRRWLEDGQHPLFDRVTQMAIPPGSVFKVLSAIALLESSTVVGNEPFFCRGYLHSPESWRCNIFVHQGVGHGEVTLVDAIARSCNVYFFHHAARAGPEPLADWALRLGFGRPTSIDLPGEASGTLPTPASIRTLEGHPWRTTDTQAMAIGQSSLAVTPLQVVRMMAAVANGGQLVTPHVVRGLAIQSRSLDAEAPPSEERFVRPMRPVKGLRRETLDLIRRGLLSVVADEQGTAHATVFLDKISVAGKTGTAETGRTPSGEPKLDHAWFAGYAPAGAPRVAFVVVLEHAGSGALAAGPVARRLVSKMDQLGLLGRR